MAENGLEFIDEPDTELDAEQASEFSQAVLHSADWTVETIVSQLTRGNIEMNPRFQRRDAWTTRRKSLFVESLILGLPVPQIVLAEKRGQRGRYIVLDGKQRLLTLLQFTGNANGQNNAFRLSGLEARGDLARKSYQTLSTDPAFEDDLNALLNYTIRTVVIRNWPSYDFLHLVFLRLNTGSVKLSQQELRPAMFPGEFSDYVDDAAGDSEALRELLGKGNVPARRRSLIAASCSRAHRRLASVGIRSRVGRSRRQFSIFCPYRYLPRQSGPRNRNHPVVVSSSIWVVALD